MTFFLMLSRYAQKPQKAIPSNALNISAIMANDF